MIGPERADTAVLRRISRRVEDILQAAREREQRGQTLALDIDARFRLQDYSAVQFQLASAILEEMGDFREEEVVSELLSLGLAAVLNGAARAVAGNDASLPLSLDDDLSAADGDWLDAPAPSLAFTTSRTIN